MTWTSNMRLIYYTEIHRLSKSRKLDRLYNLKSEVEIFWWVLRKIISTTSLHIKKLFFYLACLADFFKSINFLNLKLQGWKLPYNLMFKASCGNIKTNEPNFSFPCPYDLLEDPEICHHTWKWPWRPNFITLGFLSGWINPLLSRYFVRVLAVLVNKRAILY